MKRARRVAALLLACASVGALAQRQQQAQIEALLQVVETSGCAMERNGTLHDAKEGADHLRMALARAGERVQTVEQFNEGVASGRSRSGRPFCVPCAGAPPQLAADGLLHGGPRRPACRAEQPPCRR
jgi:uncharacterized low-complexity protein